MSEGTIQPSRIPAKTRRAIAITNAMPRARQERKVMERDPDEDPRLSSGRAVAAAFLLFGLILIAVFLFFVVLIQRVC
ncbi:MAG TPA: hypothetical protein VGQ75_08435 [Thermoanaerobaculia bacterium]|jgi:hypothetical protein|nr:hypothetical protein [Thermoanaerobaculia bacterium]